MTEIFSVHSVEDEDSLISPSQLSLTQGQRDRIAQQKKLALARRSAKAEALYGPNPSNPPPKDKEHDAFPSSFRAADLLNEVRNSQNDGKHGAFSSSFQASDHLNKVKNSPLSTRYPLGHPSLSGSISNHFRKFSRKPFLPPQVISLEDDCRGISTDSTHSDRAKGIRNREGHSNFNIGSTCRYGITASYDTEQEGSPDESVANGGHSGATDSDLMVASNVTGGQKRQWLWLPVKAMDNSNKSKDHEVSRRPRIRARREARDRRCRKSKIEETTVNSDDGWKPVRKRSLPGQIFGNVSSNTPDKGLSQQLNSKLLSIKKPQVKFAMSSQQRKVLLAIAARKSIFITGSAGTGKSFLLHEAVNTLRNMYSTNSVFITASTGLAACAIGGTTLHSFAGIGLGLGEKGELANKVAVKRDARKRWIDCKALIIDEISMIDGELFDKLEYIARSVRGSLFKDKVFGGIQLVVTGDFFQLPPVHPENPEKYFAFQASCWNDCFDFQVELTHVFRQSDSEFVKMLNELRRGQCSSATHFKLSSCDRPVQATNSGILMTKLYPRKMDVGKENEQKLRSLNQETVAFLAVDESKSEFAKRQLENVRAESELYLSVGAQVMLVKNVDSSVGLVNGARGVVVRFASVNELEEGKDIARKISPSGFWPVVLFACDGVERILRPESWSVMDGNTEVAKRTQMPLILAWALSVHKCQGMTLDRVEIDLSKSFEYGMVYVALSRVKCLEGLKLIGFDPSLVKVHSNVTQFYEELKTGELL